jgi:hypothetical protein
MAENRTSGVWTEQVPPAARHKRRQKLRRMAMGGGVVVLVKPLEEPEDSARINKNVEKLLWRKGLKRKGNGIQN